MSGERITKSVSMSRESPVYFERPIAINDADLANIPDERYGLVMVFRTFDRASFALVMEASRPVAHRRRRLPIPDIGVAAARRTLKRPRPRCIMPLAADTYGVAAPVPDARGWAANLSANYCSPLAGLSNARRKPQPR